MKLLSFFLFSTISYFAHAASDSTYTNFINCLASTSIPKSDISKILYNPTNPSYTSVLQAYIRNQRFNTSATPKPDIIVTPLVESHVQPSILCAKSVGIQLKIRSGGHDYEGLSYISNVPFIILDMFNIRSIDVNVNDQTAWVQTGATLGELYYAIWQKSKVLAFPAGVGTTVGVGGHISGGGYGNLLRKYGLSVDNVLDARMVDVKGRILDRKSMGEDVFWAICGGGGASFGVVLAYQVKLVAVPPVVTVFRVEKTLAENATQIVNDWQFVANKIDNNLFNRLLIQPVTPAKVSSNSFSQKADAKKTIRATFIAEYLGNSDQLVSLMNKEFPQLGLKKPDCTEMSWVESVLFWDNFDLGTPKEVLLQRTPKSVKFLKRKSDYLKTPISKEGLESLWQKMIELGKVGLVFNPYGGKMDEFPESATPFPHRAGNIFKIQYSVNWDIEGDEAVKEFVGQSRQLYEFMTPFVSKNPREAFLNYRDIDIGVNNNGNNSYEEGKVYGVKFFKGNFDRLVKAKTMIDPENFFRNEQSIPTFPSK